MDPSTESTSPSTQNVAAKRMGKRKVCLFLLLVVLALALVGLIAYILLFATPHTDPKIQEAPHSRSLLQPPSAGIPRPSIS